MRFEIEPGVIAISGGAGDIGQAIARMAVEAGCRVALGDVQFSVPPDHHFHGTLDVADPEAVAQWYDRVEAHFGEAPRYVIANTATVTLKPLLSLSSEEWEREISVNLSGTYHFAAEGARRLSAANRRGAIVAIGSWAGHAPHRQLPAYSVSKAGVRMLVQTLALELADRGITVNEVAPGYVDAGLSGRIFRETPRARDQAKAAVPIGELLSADDVAAQVGYLLTPAARQITGTTLLIDGGLSLLQGPTL